MTLQISQSLRFSANGQLPELGNDPVNDFLALSRKIQSDFGPRNVVEQFKEKIAHASGQENHSSSSLSWAETDLLKIARKAASNPVEFVLGFCNACDHLGSTGSSVPGHDIINSILVKHNIPVRIDKNELVSDQNHVPAPAPHPTASEVLKSAISDAELLIETSGPANALDRVHTALHAYLRELCAASEIMVASDATISKLLKQLRKEHPALKPGGHRSDDIQRVIQSMASTVDAISTLRNNASLAHVNVLLEAPEAYAAINATRTVFKYIQDCVSRYTNSGA